MSDPLQLRLSGAGGQGLITAGVILAEAALRDGKEVVQTQMYGPSARLGASRSEVIISDHEIAYPEVTDLDLLLCMSQEALEKYLPRARAETRVLVDASTTDFDPSEYENPERIRELPITEVAKELGNKVVANVVALGVLNATEQLVAPESLQAAVRRRVPERFRALNEEALDTGASLGRSPKPANQHSSTFVDAE
ncbi:MAG: 2-oxoacid:acceptor oxidoreductase family protein [Salinibacter sp.]